MPAGPRFYLLRPQQTTCGQYPLLSQRTFSLVSPSIFSSGPKSAFSRIALSEFGRTVFHLYQTQSMWRSRGARLTTVCGAQDLSKSSHRDLAPAHLQESPDNTPHHAIEKSIGFDLQVKHAPGACYAIATPTYRGPPRCTDHAPYRRTRAAARIPCGRGAVTSRWRPKGGKVVLADKERRGSVHSSQIQRLRDPQGGPPEQWTAYRIVPDRIPVSPAAGIEPGMKARLGLGQSQDSDILRKDSVPGTVQIRERMPPMGRASNNLTQGMDAAVRTPRSNQAYVFLCYLCQCPFQHPLNGTHLTITDRVLPSRPSLLTGRLNLKPTKVGAVIGHRGPYGAHCGRRIKRTLSARPGTRIRHGEPADSRVGATRSPTQSRPSGPHRLCDTLA
jgi:hypothetical protein